MDSLYRAIYMLHLNLQEVIRRLSSCGHMMPIMLTSSQWLGTLLNPYINPMILQVELIILVIAIL